ncbi:MAG TPA: hypothetical protein VKA06_03010 [Spirochaetia bacterium]|nr:hypothetical protein [Spirochaetia bacterium]
MSRSVRVPRFLHELHGDQTTRFDLVLTYLVAIGTAFLIVLRPGTRPVATLWWEIAIVAIIGGDLAGGAVANFTTGTDRYYSARPKLRLVFLALHVLHPLILYFIIGGPPEVWIAIPLFALVSAFVVNGLPRELQPTVAAVLTVAGIMICFSWFVIAPPALWFGPLFLVKLVLGFSVRRAIPETGS